MLTGGWAAARASGEADPLSGPSVLAGSWIST